ncbi:MAG: histidine phosphatase family protein, partial [Flavobacteriaceae bacterium]|nr:histidine phosphatase family protein [Flavobacteriaceae bacterium]
NDEINNEKDITFFKELYEWKRNNGNQPKNAILKTVNFINSIYDYVDKTIQKSNLTTFYRHQKTILNDGTFLGINRNPSIQPVNVIVDKFKYDIGYHSSLIRSLETIQFYNCKKIIETELLDEIDYGLVEGLTLEKVKEEFPNIIDQWSEGKDPKFPSGENQKDVFKRVEKFFSQFINTNENSLVISHLVLLRMILVYICKIEILAVHRLKIDHLEGFRVYYSMNKIIPNLSQEFRKKIRTQLSNYE